MVAQVSGRRRRAKEERNQCQEILKKLESLSDPSTVAGMTRFGINPRNTYGVSIPKLRKLVRQIGHSHRRAQQLWSSGVHEARILAALIDSPESVSEKQMENWVKDFDSWDICDGCCRNLFNKTEFAYSKAVAWSERRAEFIKRAGFVLMAQLAVHDNLANDKKLIKFFPIIRREATDHRNFVKKAVNWALRQIGKRSRYLNQLAIKTATEIRNIDSKAARWIAADALRELTSAAVQMRLRTRH